MSNVRMPVQQGPDARPEFEFDSVSHMMEVAFARGHARACGSASECDEVLRGQGSSWVNHATTDSLTRSMREPQPRLVGAVQDMKRRIEDAVQSPTRERRKLRRRQEDGDDLDPQAVAERRLDAWDRVEHRSVPKHVVTIGINLSVSSSCRPEHLLYRGAAAAALADLLTQGGHSVEVVGFLAASHPSADYSCESVLTRVVVKPADVPLDITSLSVALAEIGYFRLVVMVAMGRVLPTKVSGGFGRPRSLSQEERRGVDVVLDAGVFSQDQAERVVREAMSKFGAEEGKEARWAH